MLPRFELIYPTDDTYCFLLSIAIWLGLMCVKLILWFFQIACYGHIELFWEILLEWRGLEPSKGETGWGGGGGGGYHNIWII